MPQVNPIDNDLPNLYVPAPDNNDRGTRPRMAFNFKTSLNRPRTVPDQQSSGGRAAGPSVSRTPAPGSPVPVSPITSSSVASSPATKTVPASLRSHSNSENSNSQESESDSQESDSQEKQDELLIGVIGITGAGKSTFISHLTDQTVTIGHNLKSCTSNISVYPAKISGHKIALIDTPGFLDTSRSDTEILTIIAQYLEEAYSQNIKLSGLIYLHPITDTRMTNVSIKNLKMFRNLIGDNNLNKVVFVTNKWEAVDKQLGVQRQKELVDDYWYTCITNGARVFIHDGKPETAKKIVDLLVKNDRFYSNIQVEMCQENTPLEQTEAGRIVMAGLDEAKKELTEEIEFAMENLMEEVAKEDRNENVMSAFRKDLEQSQKKFHETIEQEHQMHWNSMKLEIDRLNKQLEKSSAEIRRILAMYGDENEAESGKLREAQQAVRISEQKRNEIQEELEFERHKNYRRKRMQQEFESTQAIRGMDMDSQHRQNYYRTRCLVM